MSDEQRPLTYEELQSKVENLRRELDAKDKALNAALRDIVFLREQVNENRLRKTPRVLDPNSTDAFSRPFR